MSAPSAGTSSCNTPAVGVADAGLGVSVLVGGVRLGRAVGAVVAGATVVEVGTTVGMGVEVATGGCTTSPGAGDTSRVTTTVGEIAPLRPPAAQNPRDTTRMATSANPPQSRQPAGIFL